MLRQEATDAEPFIEEEVAEATLPALNWRLEARARVPRLVRGGVLADEVGYGEAAQFMLVVYGEARPGIHIQTNKHGFTERGGRHARVRAHTLRTPPPPPRARTHTHTHTHTCIHTNTHPDTHMDTHGLTRPCAQLATRGARARAATRARRSSC